MWGEWGGGCGPLITWSPNKLGRSNSIFNLCCMSFRPCPSSIYLSMQNYAFAVAAVRSIGPLLSLYKKPIFVTIFADLRRSSWWWWACPRRASPCPPPGWSPAPSPPSSGSPWWAHRAARQQTSGLKQDSFIKGSISREIFGVFLHAGIDTGTSLGNAVQIFQMLLK